jgi:hypothetical protein
MAKLKSSPSMPTPADNGKYAKYIISLLLYMYM